MLIHLLEVGEKREEMCLKGANMFAPVTSRTKDELEKKVSIGIA